MLIKIHLEETTSQDTGMTSQVVKDWRIPGATKQPNYRPRMEIVDENDKILKLANGSQAIYELPVSAVLSIGYKPGKKNKKINAGDFVSKNSIRFSKVKRYNRRLA